MYSPIKLTNFEENSKEICNNFDLQQKLYNFFNKKENEFLWEMNKTRQTVTTALRHTKSIYLRNSISPETISPINTLEWNQIMTLSDTRWLYSIPIFWKTFNWIKKSLLNHCNNPIIGKIFFSKLSANCEIDLHTDEGKYFDYYDRFHFVIQGTNNIFHIRDEDIMLEVGHMYWVNNHVPHWLINNSNEDRINLIFDARLTN